MNKEILVYLYFALTISLISKQVSALGVSLIAPEEIGTVGNKTFHISPEKFGQGATWADALTYCQRAGLILASIESVEEREAVSDFLLKDTQSAARILQNVWTSGTDFFTEGEWYWLSSRLPVDFAVSKTSEDVTAGPWYNCLYMDPEGNLKSNFCDFSIARALCQSRPADDTIL